MESFSKSGMQNNMRAITSLVAADALKTASEETASIIYGDLARAVTAAEVIDCLRRCAENGVSLSEKSSAALEALREATVMQAATLAATRLRASENADSIGPANELDGGAMSEYNRLARIQNPWDLAVYLSGNAPNPRQASAPPAAIEPVAPISRHVPSPPRSHPRIRTRKKRHGDRETLVESIFHDARTWSDLVRKISEAKLPSGGPRLESNGFTNSPQKDLAREEWASFCRNNLGQLRATSAAFSLLGEDARDLSIYRDLGIGDAHIFGAEHNPQIFEKMKRLPAHVISGDCREALAKIQERVRFTVINLDFCASMKDVADAGQLVLLERMDPRGCCVGITTRARQDPASIDLGVHVLRTTHRDTKFQTDSEEIFQRKRELFGPSREERAGHSHARDIDGIWRICAAVPAHVAPEHEYRDACLTRARAARLLVEQAAKCGVLGMSSPAKYLTAHETLLAIGNASQGSSQLTRAAHAIDAELANKIRLLATGAAFHQRQFMRSDRVNREFLRTLREKREAVAELLATQDHLWLTPWSVSALERFTYDTGPLHTMNTWLMRFATHKVVQSRADLRARLVHHASHSREVFIDQECAMHEIPGKECRCAAKFRPSRQGEEIRRRSEIGGR